jgi:hypothetical protein
MKIRALIAAGFESGDGSPTAGDGGGKGRRLDQELIGKKPGRYNFCREKAAPVLPLSALAQVFFGGQRGAGHQPATGDDTE